MKLRTVVSPLQFLAIGIPTCKESDENSDFIPIQEDDLGLFVIIRFICKKWPISRGSNISSMT